MNNIRLRFDKVGPLVLGGVAVLRSPNLNNSTNFWNVNNNGGLNNNNNANNANGVSAGFPKCK